MFNGCFFISVFDDEMVEDGPEVLPAVGYNSIAAGVVGLEGADIAVVEAEVDQLAAQSGTQP